MPDIFGEKPQAKENETTVSLRWAAAKLMASIRQPVTSIPHRGLHSTELSTEKKTSNAVWAVVVTRRVTQR